MFKFLVLEKKLMEFFILHLACFLAVRYHELYAIRASGLIPVIPLTTIIKILNFQLCIVEQAINYWCPDWIHHSYLYQSGKIHNVLYYTKYVQGSCKAIAGYTWR